jgi:hypothetical protein
MRVTIVTRFALIDRDADGEVALIPVSFAQAAQSSMPPPRLTQ